MQENSNQETYGLLMKKLDDFIRRFYINRLIRGSIYFASILLVLFLCLVLLEHFGQFSSRVRTLLFFGTLGLTTYVFIRFIYVPCSKLFAFGKRISHEQAAKIIGSHFREVDDKLANLIQLKDQTTDASFQLLEASIEQKSKQLQPVPFRTAINLGENKRYGKYLIPPLLILLFLLFYSPSLLSDSTTRLVKYSEEFIPIAPFQFEITNKTLSAFKDEDYTLMLKLKGQELPDQVYVQFEKAAYRMNKSSAQEFSFTLKNIQKSQGFYLKASDYESKNFEIQVLAKPSVLDFEVKVDYPKYLSRSSETFKNTGELIVPKGSQLRWRFYTKATEELEFKMADSSYRLLPHAKDEFQFETRVYASGSYQIKSHNSVVSEGDSLSYELEVTPDRYPSIELDVEMDSSLMNALFFNGLIKDDYGFSRLVFYSQKVDKSGKASLPNQRQISINTQLPQSDFYHQLSLKEFELEEGDFVKYYFEVWDNDGVSGSKSAKTPYYEFRVPSNKELVKKENQASDLIKSELTESIDLAKEIRDDLALLKEKMLQKKSPGRQEKKLLEEVLQKQQKIKNSIEKAQKENSQKNKLRSEFNPLDETLQEKQKQLEDLFEKVMSEEMKQMLDEIEKMMEQLNKENLEQALEKMELNNEEVEKELDRNLELFKALELEKDIEDAQKKLEALQKEELELNEKTQEKRADNKDLAKKQDELKEDFEELEKNLEDIKKKNAELEEPKDMKDTGSLEEQIKNDMKESSEELSKKNKKKADQKQKEAMDKMEELAESLDQMQMQMESESNAENLEDLRFLLENLIQLSFDQEDLMLDLKDLDGKDPRYVSLAQDQKKLKDDAKIIEDSLFALSKRVLQLGPIVNKEVGAINYNMDKAIALLGDRQTPKANQRQQLAMTSINNLALLLDEAIQNMQSQMQMQGNGECKKPGGGKPSPGGMKKMQEALNKQMESLKKAMENGEKPGGEKGNKPGSGGKGGMSKELAQMAAKQAAIREALKEMQEQLEGQGAGAGGQLEKLGDLMEQTETDLVNKRISNETILRQQEILTRLLESEKAEKEREKEEKRESIEFSDEISRNPKLFLEYTKQKEKEVELLRTLPPSFNPFYKQKVSDYFKTIQP